MTILIYIVSLSITLIIKRTTAKLLYKKFGTKCTKYFNISTSILAFLVMSYYIFIYTNKHPAYPAMFGGTLGIIFGSIKITSDSN